MQGGKEEESRVSMPYTCTMMTIFKVDAGK